MTSLVVKYHNATLIVTQQDGSYINLHRSVDRVSLKILGEALLKPEVAADFNGGEYAAGSGISPSPLTHSRL